MYINILIAIIGMAGLAAMLRMLAIELSSP